MPSPPGLIGWWRAEGDANDSAGTNSGVFMNGTTFAPGKVSQAFSFNGVNQVVQVPDSPTLNPTSAMTLEAWVYVEAFSSNDGVSVFGKDDPNGARQFLLGMGNVSGSWVFRAHLNVASGFMYFNGSTAIQLHTWYHVAMTYDGASLRLYVNGTLDGSTQATGAIVLTTNPILIGGSVPGPWNFNGRVDELSLYNRGLSSNEIQALFTSGSAGKCTTPTAPVIFSQPASETVLVGDTAAFTVTTAGTQPLNYQWTFNGSDIPGATNSSLVLNNVQTNQAGNYSVSITNIVGGLTSSNAVLTVNQVAPSIVSQPANATVLVGQTAAFSVSANGTQPLSYQWAFNGTAITSATNSSLTLNTVQTNQAGNYSVTVSNVAGIAISSNAVLIVRLPPVCTPPPPGLISWWQAEGNANDAAAGNNGTLQNGASFAPGMVGQAFSFSGGSVVSVPDSPSLNPTAALTLEAWVYFSHFPNNDVALVGKDNPFGARQYLIGMGNVSGQWVFRAHIGVPSGFNLFNGQIALQTNNWYHVAITYDGSTLTLFVNGVLDSNLSVSGPIVTSGDSFLIGGYGSSQWDFDGLIDEPTLYDRALSAQEINTIYQAADGGKCLIPFPPTIAAQPANQSVTVGQTTSLSVGSGGTQPLSYQWSFNGSAIQGATNASLDLTNVQFAQAGSYSVQVTNAVGSIISSNAVLTVNYPPATVQALVSTIAPDGSVSLSIIVIANGNEHGLGFSLNFLPSLLSYTEAAVGSSANGATFLVNTNQTTTGRLGIALELPSSSTFAPGTQQVATVNFMAAALTTTAFARVTFGDLPTTRQLSDPQANPLAATFVPPATFTIPAASFEGDVSPRPNGDKALTITDWVLVGRYAARLDYPTNASEYQRADCAPASTLGDGAITVADWVQAGRYAAGLDPAVRAGGPTNDLGPNVVSAGTSKSIDSTSNPHPKGTSPRQIKFGNGDLAPGQTGTVAVLLEAQGNENALGFSLNFDPTVFTFTGATLGSGAAGAVMNVNSAQANAGKVALVMALPTGSSFSAGTKDIAQINFSPVTNALGNYAIAFTDQPVIRQVVDPTSAPLTTDFINGNITVNPLPALNVAKANQNVLLSWPLWATNFSLQEAVSSTGSSLNWTNVPASFGITNGEAVVTVPADAAAKFYRLKK